MNTARILSTATIAAAAALASMGAYAAPAAGEFSAMPEAVVTASTQSRAQVMAEAKTSMPEAGDFYTAAKAPQQASLTRAEVRSEAVMAIRTNEIATGNFS